MNECVMQRKRRGSVEWQVVSLILQSYKFFRFFRFCDEY